MFNTFLRNFDVGMSHGLGFSQNFALPFFQPNLTLTFYIYYAYISSTIIIIVCLWNGLIMEVI